MKKQEEKNSELKQDKLGEKSGIRKWLILYFDIVIRGFISFIGIGVLLSLLLIVVLKMSPIIVLPIAFILAVLLSPFLSKLTLGERFLTFYENLLDKIFKRTLK